MSAHLQNFDSPRENGGTLKKKMSCIKHKMNMNQILIHGYARHGDNQHS